MSSIPKIDTYSFGKIIINGQSYSKDVIIFPDRIRKDWWRTSGHSLLVVDMEEIMSEEMELLVVGTGAYGRMKVPIETKNTIEGSGAELILAPTSEACDLYNEFREKKRTIAALHLTC